MNSHLHYSNTSLYKAQEKRQIVSKMEHIIAIKLGIHHSSNACKITSDKPKYCEEISVIFGDNIESKLNTLTTPTMALFDDNGAIQSYGFEAEIHHYLLDNTCNHFFREFIWDLFCSDEKVN